MNGREWKENSTHLVSGGDLEGDVLADGRRRTIRSRLVPLLVSELCPLLPLRNSMLYDGLLEGSLDLPCNLVRLGRTEGETCD